MSAATVDAERFAAGGLVLVGDDAGPLFVAAPADDVDADALERLQRLGGGLVVLALDEAIARRLELSEAVARARRPMALPLTAPIDAATGIAGGWSLRDRAHTMRVAARPDAGPGDLAVPGHVHAARIERSASAADVGAASAALELARASGRTAAVALCAVVDAAGAPGRLEEARADPELARLPIASAASLRGRRQAEHVQELAVRCALPTRHGDFRAAAYVAAPGGEATLALVHGEPNGRPRPLVHAHAGCMLGEVFGSRLCGCRAALDAALAEIVAEGAGILLYAKPAAGAEPVCARPQPVDAPIAAGLLRAAGASRVRIASGQRALAAALRALGLDVAVADPAGPPC
jgi:3,4-dihydroxy 2-butanone 4-phosphate synthase/GTP cyclohydrolase II